MKKRYFAIPILAVALHFLLSNLLYFLVERLVLDVFHISPQQFMKYSYWGEILIYVVLILVFFTLYKLLWRKEISEPRTATNFKDVLGSLVVDLAFAESPVFGSCWQSSFPRFKKALRQ